MAIDSDQTNRWDIPAVAVLASVLALVAGGVLGLMFTVLFGLVFGPLPTGDENRGVFVIFVLVGIMAMLPVCTFLLIRGCRARGERLWPTVFATALSPLTVMSVVIVVGGIVEWRISVSR